MNHMNGYTELYLATKACKFSYRPLLWIDYESCTESLSEVKTAGLRLPLRPVRSWPNQYFSRNI